MAAHLNVDAYDWFRGLRPWQQFLDFIDYVSEIEGSACWAAKLSDPELVDQIEREMREGNMPTDFTSLRPGLFGYTRTVAGLVAIANQLISHRIEQGGAKVPHIKTPLMPTEVAEERVRLANKVRRESAADRARERWGQLHGQPAVTHA